MHVRALCLLGESNTDVTAAEGAARVRKVTLQTAKRRAKKAKKRACGDVATSVGEIVLSDDDG